MVDFRALSREAPSATTADRAVKAALAEAAFEIDRLRAELDLARREVAAERAAYEALRPILDRVCAKLDAPDDGYLPGLNSTMCDAPIRSPEEQFTRRMLRVAIARCLFPNLPDEREWWWNRDHLKHRDNEFRYSKVASVVLFWKPYNKDQEYKCAPIWPEVWDKAWRETGMK